MRRTALPWSRTWTFGTAATALAIAIARASIRASLSWRSISAGPRSQHEALLFCDALAQPATQLDRIQVGSLPAERLDGLFDLALDPDFLCKVGGHGVRDGRGDLGHLALDHRRILATQIGGHGHRQLLDVLASHGHDPEHGICRRRDQTFPPSALRRPR